MIFDKNSIIPVIINKRSLINQWYDIYQYINISMTLVSLFEDNIDWIFPDIFKQSPVS